jgi:hypothetical protein
MKKSAGARAVVFLCADFRAFQIAQISLLKDYQICVFITQPSCGKI